MSSNDEQSPWVIRTCFSDDQTWGLIKKQVAAPQRDPMSGMDFTANVRFVEDPSLANLSRHQIVRLLPADYPSRTSVVFASLPWPKEYAINNSSSTDF